eukprot:SAG31_NODE_17065_length_684_cov_1.967521_1_plen_94_part_10
MHGSKESQYKAWQQNQILDYYDTLGEALSLGKEYIIIMEVNHKSRMLTALCSICSDCSCQRRQDDVEVAQDFATRALDAMTAVPNFGFMTFYGT